MPGSNNVLAAVGDLTSFLEETKSPPKEETPGSEMQNKSWQVYSYFTRLASSQITTYHYASVALFFLSPQLA